VRLYFYTKSKTIFSLAVFLSGFLSITNAQTIVKGRVLDGNTKEPLEAVTIKLKGNNTTTVTDKLGNFLIKTNDNSPTLIASYIGYTSKEFSLAANENIITLDKGNMNLEEVVITGSLNDNHFNTISKIDLNLRPARSAQEFLRIVPGLFIAQHAGGGKAEQIFLRGFDIDHGTDIQVSVDGLPVNMVSHAHGQGYADLHFLIPELVNNIDYGKGPYYADRGNLNTSGYVNMQTVKSIDKNRIQAEAGQFNNFRALGMLNLLPKSNKKQNAYLASELLYFDGPFLSPQNFKRFNIFGKYNASIGRNTEFSFFTSAFSSQWDASGQIPERAVESGMVKRFGAIDDTEGGNTHRYNVSAGTTTGFSNGNLLETQLFYSRYDFELYSNFTFFLDDDVNGDQIRQVDERDIFGLNSKYIINRYNGNSKFKTTIGLNFRADRTYNTELSHTKDRTITLEQIKLGDITESNTGIYIDEKIEHNKWLINVGARFDYLHFKYMDELTSNQKPSQDRAIVSPKVNVQYTVNPAVQLYFKAGKGFHSNDTRVVVSNDGKEILPAAYGSDLGVILHPAKKLLLNAAVWYLYLQQEFVYVGDAGITEPSGKTRRVGVDFSGRYQFTSHLFVDANVNLARGRFTESAKGENYIPLAPTVTSTGGVSYQNQMGLNGSLRYRYLKNRPANETNTVTAKGYFVTDAAINYSKTKFEVGLAIENLFNTKWNEAQFDTESRLKDEPNPVSELHFTPGVPFFAKIKATLFF
jgi:hypothetical protein